RPSTTLSRRKEGNVGSFIHHPDGYIVVNEFQFPLHLFVQAEPEYAPLPDGFDGRIYVQGEKHALISRNGEAQQPLDWADGDLYISRADQYADQYAAWLLAQNPPPEPDPAGDALSQLRDDVTAGVESR